MATTYITDLEGQLLIEGEQDLTGLQVFRNIDYIEGADYADDKDKLDIFMPKDAKDVPVVMFFHGGALKGGTKVDGEALAARIVRDGVGVVSANYQLTPTVQHPRHVNDAAAAFAWVVKKIKQYGGNPNNIYLSGHSAGAYLAVLLALDPIHLESHGISNDVLKGVVPISPFLYVEETAKVRPKDVWGKNPVDWLAASVTPHIKSGKPPILLIYADGDEDWRREQIERFVVQMNNAGNISVSSREVKNRDHFTIITQMKDKDDEIRSVVLNFINKN